MEYLLYKNAKLVILKRRMNKNDRWKKQWVFCPKFEWFVQGPRELSKSGGAKSPISPHFSEKLGFIAFLCDNFLGFQKSGGGRGPPGPPSYDAPAGISTAAAVSAFNGAIGKAIIELLL